MAAFPILLYDQMPNHSPPSTPQKPANKKRKHFTTPQKAKVQGTIEYLEAKHIPYSKEEVFQHFDVGRTQGYEILKIPSARRVQNDPSRTDARSESHRKVTKEHVQQIEEWFEAGTEHGELDAHWLPPATLAYELDVDVSKRAMQKVIKTQTDYSKCIACRKPWIDPDYKPRRKEFCRKMLEERPTKEDY